MSTQQGSPCLLTRRPQHRILRPRLTILRLPGKVIPQRRHRLPDKTERTPEDQIAHQLRPISFPLPENVRQEDQRNLHHHAHEGKSQHIVRRHSDQDLVQESREDEMNPAQRAGEGRVGGRRDVESREARRIYGLAAACVSGMLYILFD